MVSAFRLSGNVTEIDFSQDFPLSQKFKTTIGPPLGAASTEKREASSEVSALSFFQFNSNLLYLKGFPDLKSLKSSTSQMLFKLSLPGVCRFA